MSKIEIVSGVRENFTMIPNSLIRSPGLRSRTIHVYAYLRSHMSGWKLNIRSVAEATGLSKDTVTAAINDLIDLGYVSRTPQEGSKGRFPDYVYRVFDVPTCPKKPDPSEKVGQASPSEKVGQDPSEKVGQAPVLKSRTLNKTKNNTKLKDYPPYPPEGETADAVKEVQGEIVSAELVPVAEEQEVPDQKKKPTSRGSRLEDGWYPDARTISRVRSEHSGITDAYLEREHRKFTDYWLSKAGAAARKVDWNRTWSNWIRTAMERNPDPATRNDAAAWGAPPGNVKKIDWDNLPPGTYLSDLED